MISIHRYSYDIYIVIQLLHHNVHRIDCFHAKKMLPQDLVWPFCYVRETSSTDRKRVLPKISGWQNQDRNSEPLTPCSVLFLLLLATNLCCLISLLCILTWAERLNQWERQAWWEGSLSSRLKAVCGRHRVVCKAHLRAQQAAGVEGQLVIPWD